MFDWSVSKEEEEEKQTNKIGSLLFEAMVDTFFLEGNGRHLDVQNINKKNHEFGLIIYSNLKI